MNEPRRPLCRSEVAAQTPASKVVLITGASSGIGSATARHLLKQGFRVHATARKVEALHDLKNAGCDVLRLDVTDDASMREAVEAIQSRDGAIGALVNNAGYGQPGALETLPIDAVRRQFETNLFGALRLAQLVLPGIRKVGSGRIVNLS